MNYKFHPQIILRAPLLPIKSEFDKEQLINLFKRTKQNEALFIASPSLHESFTKYCSDSQFEKSETKLFNTLLKYALRMHNRATPFGLFSACGVIDSQKRKIELSEKDYIRSTRLDMSYVCSLAKRLSEIPEIRKILNFYPNSSIYYVDEKIRFIEYTYNNNNRIHEVSEVRNTQYIEKVLNSSKDGLSAFSIAKILESSEEVDFDDAYNFVNALIDEQLLVSELEPSLTGDDILNQIYTKLESKQLSDQNSTLENVLNLLSDLIASLRQLDLNRINVISDYKEIYDKLRIFDLPFDKSKLFQTDSFISQPLTESDESVASSIQSDLTYAIKVLNKYRFADQNFGLNRFKEKFVGRYEDQEMPLAEVLDPETGIGYSLNDNHSGTISPLVDQLNLPKVYNSLREVSFHPNHIVVLKKLLDSIKVGSKIIQLTEDDFDGIENWDDLPPSISVIYNVVESTESLNKLYLRGAVGVSALNLISRFGTDSNIQKIMLDIVEKEEEYYVGKEIATILHLPEDRTGNILLRPRVRKYEIPYLSNSDSESEFKLDISDLRISIKNERIILRSKKLNKEIVPRLDNAHNFTLDPLPVYHFLCDLQYQKMRNNLSFNWGPLQKEFQFLPRVEVKGVIISPAIWQLSSKDFSAIIKNSSTVDDLTNWRNGYEIPEKVVLAEGDNELVLNLLDELSISLFKSLLSKKNNVVFHEYLFHNSNSFVKNEKGEPISNECIAILTKDTTAITLKPNPITESTVASEIQRQFSIGSEWLYFKIYCGYKTADKLLTQLFKGIIQELLNLKLITAWFFVRYSDPEPHLRIRFKLNQIENISRVVSFFNHETLPLVESGVIWRIQTDTYKRELERYGYDSIEIIEQFYFHDSNFILDIIDELSEKKNDSERWLTSLKTVDLLLDNFSLTLNEKYSLIEILKTNFASEFAMNKNLRSQLDTRYRNSRKDIVLTLTGEKFQYLNNHFESYTQQTASMCQEIVLQAKTNKLKVELSNLLMSMIHMQLNRLFPSKQRMHEMVVYDYLWKYYRSELAQLKSK